MFTVYSWCISLIWWLLIVGFGGCVYLCVLLVCVGVWVFLNDLIIGWLRDLIVFWFGLCLGLLVLLLFAMDWYFGCWVDLMCGFSVGVWVVFVFVLFVCLVGFLWWFGFVLMVSLLCYWFLDCFDLAVDLLFGFLGLVLVGLLTLFVLVVCFGFWICFLWTSFVWFGFDVFVYWCGSCYCGFCWFNWWLTVVIGLL